MNVIFYVLRTGCQWNAIPRRLGASSEVVKRFHSPAYSLKGNPAPMQAIWDLKDGSKSRKVLIHSEHIKDRYLSWVNDPVTGERLDRTAFRHQLAPAIDDPIDGFPEDDDHEWRALTKGRF